MSAPASRRSPRSGPDIGQTRGVFDAVLLATDPASNYDFTRRTFLGQPRGRFSVMIAPRTKISPPQTPCGSCHPTAPARQARRIGQGWQYSLASCRSKVSG